MEMDRIDIINLYFATLDLDKFDKFDMTFGAVFIGLGPSLMTLAHKCEDSGCIVVRPTHQKGN